MYKRQLLERTISGMMGKGSVNHNTRAFSAKNVDKERSRDNVEFCHKDIKAVYHELFDDCLLYTSTSTVLLIRSVQD